MSRPARLAAFVRAFIPEQLVQLLFPVASFLLLLGASYPWYHLPVAGFKPDMVANPAEAARVARALNLVEGWEQAVPRFLAQFGFFASLALWTLPLRSIESKLRRWVVLPVGAALAGYPAFLVLTASQRNASLDALAKFSSLPVSVSHSWFRSLGHGWYLTLAGLGVLAGCLFLVRRNFISLPVRFRGDTELVDRNNSGPGRDVFVFIIGTIVLATVMSIVATVISIPLFSTALLRPQLVFGRSAFPIFQWTMASLDAVGAAGLVLFLFRDRRWQIVVQSLRVPLLSDCAIGFLLPLGVILIPRFIFKALELHLVATPFNWSEMLIPGPVPWIFAVYVTAILAEFGLRGYLQTVLERRFSLRRAILLTGLLWGLLPLGFGVAQTFPFGVSTFVRSLPTTYLPWFVALVIYSVPLGWLYARTRSIVPAALMHGTIALFHVGWGYQIHINHPQLYWVELALWTVIGWYVFRRYPVRAAAAQRIEAEPA